MKKKEKTITVSEFKAKCLRLLETLDTAGVIITKRGRPIARVSAVGRAGVKELYGSMKGKITIKGDIFSTGIKWDAES